MPPTARSTWAVMLIASAGPAAAQRGPPPPDSTGDDIIVEGIRVPPDEATAIDTRAFSSNYPGDTAVAVRQKFAFATRIAGCAARGKLAPPASLRAVVDAPWGSTTQHVAQDMLIRRTVTCSEGVSLASTEPGFLGGSIYNRGAFIMAAMRQNAPELKLTRRDTEDREIQARFNRRETPLNRFRLAPDRRFFQVSVCMVRFQPTLSVRLALDDLDRVQVNRIEQAIVAGARACVGGARTVRFEPTQFRIYIADAVYRWAVAARGVDSLIPAG